MLPRCAALRRAADADADADVAAAESSKPAALAAKLAGMHDRRFPVGGGVGAVGIV